LGWPYITSEGRPEILVMDPYGTLDTGCFNLLCGLYRTTLGDPQPVLTQSWLNAQSPTFFTEADIESYRAASH